MRIMVLGLIAFLLTACQQREDDRETRLETAERQVATVDLDAEEQAVRAEIERWQAAEETKDAGTIANLFAQDGFAIYNGEKLQGRDAIRGSYEEGYAQPGYHGSFKVEDVVVAQAGDLAYETGTYSGGYDAPQGPITSAGRYLTLWKKTPEGWRVAVDVTSDEARTAGNQPED